MNSILWHVVLMSSVVLTVSCSGKGSGQGGLASATDTPSTTGELMKRVQTLRDRMSPAEYDPKAQALALGSDYKAIFAFVRDQIRFEAYSGVLREADGTLAARAGNALDRSLLLASLLGAAKVPTRIALCDLPIERGQALYQHIFAGLEPADAVHWPDVPSGFLKRVVARSERDYPVIRAAIGDHLATLTAAAAAARAQAIEDARRHAWVQADINGKWVDLDTAFADSEPGKAYCVAKTTADTVPADWYQKVEMRVMVERVDNGVLAVAPALAVTLRTVDLAGQSIFLLHAPAKRAGGGMGLGAAAAASRGDSWVPIFMVGSDIKSGQSLDFSEGGGGGFADALGGGGNPSGLVAEWLELEVLRPDGRKDVTRRILFDRADAGWREANSHDAGLLRPIARDAVGPLAPQAIYNILFSTGPLDLTAFGDAVAWVIENGASVSEAPAAASLYPFAVHNFSALVWSEYVLVPAINNLAHIRFYDDSPRVFLVSLQSYGDGNAVGIYDLRRDRLCGLSADAQSDRLVAEQKLKFATLEGALEHEAAALDAVAMGGDPSTILSTSGLLTSAGAVYLGNEDSSRLASLSVDTQKLNQLRDSLRDARFVVVPQSSLGAAPLGYWAVAANGDARAVFAEDLNMAGWRFHRSNPTPRPPPNASKTYSILNGPGQKRGKIELTSWSRGEEYQMMLSIAEIATVGVTGFGVAVAESYKRKANTELEAWSAAEDAKQQQALRAAGARP